MEFRLATIDDVDQLVALRRDFTFEDEPASERPAYVQDCRTFYSDAVTSGRWRIWVAAVDDDIVAHLCIAIIEKVPRPTRSNSTIGYLTNVYTVTQHRAKGISGGLLATA